MIKGAKNFPTFMKYCKKLGGGECCPHRLYVHPFLTFNNFDKCVFHFKNEIIEYLIIQIKSTEDIEIFKIRFF